MLWSAIERLVLKDFEVSLLRLLEKVTNGTVIEISVTGARPETTDVRAA